MASQLISPQSWPPPSALTSFIAERTTSASASSTSETAHETTQLRNLALQVQHQLQYQYDWTELQLHTSADTLHAALHKPHEASVRDYSEGNGDSSTALSRPLLTGLPPRQLYTHPDVQIALIKSRKSEADLPIETVVVCPAHITEGGWTLERLSGVMDVLPSPRRNGFEDVLGSVQVGGRSVGELDREKRVLLAIVEADSTIVFYWVHDGLVKPRQN